MSWDDNGDLELTLVAGRGRTSEMGEGGVQRQPATTTIKTLEHGELQWTDRAVTTRRLPLRYREVEQTF